MTTTKINVKEALLMKTLVDAHNNTGNNRIDDVKMIAPNHEFRKYGTEELTETQIRVLPITELLPKALQDISPIGVAKVRIESTQKVQTQYNTFCLVTASPDEMLKAYNKAMDYDEDDPKGTFVYVWGIKVEVLHINGKLITQVVEGSIGVNRKYMETIYDKEGKFGIETGDIMPMIISKSDDNKKTYHTMNFNRAISNIVVNNDAGNIDDIFAQLEKQAAAAASVGSNLA